MCLFPTLTDILKFKDAIIHQTQEYAFAAEDARINIQKLNFYLYEAWKPPRACRRIDAARSIGGQARAAKVISLTLALTRWRIISGRTDAEMGTKCHSAASCLEGSAQSHLKGALRVKARLSEIWNAISNVNCEAILLRADVAGCLFEWVSSSLTCADCDISLRCVSCPPMPCR